MPTILARVPAVLRVCLAALLLASTTLRADLVWSPQTGWIVQGGALASVTEPEARNALDAMNRARTAEEKGDRGTALSLYLGVVKKYPRSDYAPEACFRAARLYQARQQYFAAFDAYQQVITLYPSSVHFNEIISEQYTIANQLVDGARNHYWGLIPGFTNRSKGLEYFETLITEAPQSDYAPLALMNIVRGQQKFGTSDNAIDALDRLIDSYPQSMLAPDAYLGRAQALAGLVEGPYYDQASTLKAITDFEDFSILFPQNPAQAEAEKGLASMKQVLAESKMLIGDFYFYKRDNFKAARVFYNEAITVYPDSKIAEKARQQLTAVDAAEAKAAASATGRNSTSPSTTTPARSVPPDASPPRKKWFFGLF